MDHTSKSQRKGGGSPKHSSNSVESYSSNEYSYLLAQKIRSVTMHPLGFLLTDLMHPRKDDMLINLPPELVSGLEASLTKEAYECRIATQRRLTTEFEADLGDWLASSGNEMELARKLTNNMNKVLNDGVVYVKRQRHLKRPIEEERADSRIVAHRKTGTGKHNHDPATLLIEVGGSGLHWLATAHKAICHTMTLLNKGLLKEPMVIAVLRVLPQEPAQNLSGVQLAVFLVMPSKEQDFRMALLWRGISRTAKDMVSDFTRVMQITEYVAEWNRLNPKLDNFNYLGPHCCRIGEKVSIDLAAGCSYESNLTYYYSLCLLPMKGVSLLRQPAPVHGTPSRLVLTKEQAHR
jgi:hypothetical protein